MPPLRAEKRSIDSKARNIDLGIDSNHIDKVVVDTDSLSGRLRGVAPVLRLNYPAA